MHAPREGDTRWTQQQDPAEDSPNADSHHADSHDAASHDAGWHDADASGGGGAVARKKARYEEKKRRRLKYSGAGEEEGDPFTHPDGRKRCVLRVLSCQSVVGRRTLTL
jgi:hypothetical protein